MIDLQLDHNFKEKAVVFVCVVDYSDNHMEGGEESYQRRSSLY